MAARDEIRDLMTRLTGRLSKSPEEADGHDIITLAGGNRGATMKGDMEEMTDTNGLVYGDEEMLSAYTNSNYQSINNSIVVGGSCKAEDPGVHVVLSEFMGEEEEEKKGKKEKNKKKDKKKKKTKKEDDEGQDAEGTKSEDNE